MCPTWTSQAPNTKQKQTTIDTLKVKQKGYDVCILGHWHSWTQVQDNALYPGTHEQTKFGERDAGFVALIEVESGQTPTFEKLKSGQLTWRKEQLSIDDHTEESLIASIDAIREEGCDFLHLTLTGEADIEFITDAIPRFKAAAEPRFGYLEIDSSGVQRRIDIEAMRQKTTLPPMLNAIQEDIL